MSSPSSYFFFFSSRRRHTRFDCDWSSDVCSSDLAIKYASKPVVAAPQGMALGGGCEVSLHAAKIQAAAEAYIGLVETRVSLITCGGGTEGKVIRPNEDGTWSGFCPFSFF